MPISNALISTAWSHGRDLLKFSNFVFSVENIIIRHGSVEKDITTKKKQQRIEKKEEEPRKLIIDNVTSSVTSMSNT